MAITNIQNGELGSSVRSKLNQAIQEANKVSGKQDSSGLGSAAFESVDAFDPVGSAQEAEDFAVQRENHTGTQTLSTISDAGTAAAADISDFDPAGSAAQVEQDIRRDIQRQQHDPLLTSLLF